MLRYFGSGVVIFFSKMYIKIKINLEIRLGIEVGYFKNKKQLENIELPEAFGFSRLSHKVGYP